MCYHRFFEKLNMSMNPLPYERQRPPSFMSNYNFNFKLFRNDPGSEINQEDKDYFQREEWYSELIILNNGKSLLDVNKFLKKYPHYKMEQVHIKSFQEIFKFLKKRWN